MIILNYWWQLLVAGLGVYLICNINFAVIFSKKIKHQDIRQFGSGNPGTTNVVRTFGLKMGALTFTCDLTKGVIAALIGRYLFFAFTGNLSLSIFAGFFLALCAVLGHMYPVFLKFKGGKGVATSLGAMLVLNPVLTLICLAFAVLIIFLTDKMSIFALLNITAQFIYTAIYALTNSALTADGVAIPVTVTIGIIWLVIVIAHRGNIKRLLTGTENNSGVRAGLFSKRKTEKEKTEEDKTERIEKLTEQKIEKVSENIE
ncbi:MAG TPA: glycerol-3-phosphate 1-O-acyltransferase PlsY [Clostridia bacterium]|nr:glycerol-3-phosphate 1-O-acyltransferase PlsY [Clostridia bacterium]